MRAIILMFDSLNRHMLPPYAADTFIEAPNFARLAAQAVTFDNFYAGSMAVYSGTSRDAHRPLQLPASKLGSARAVRRLHASDPGRSRYPHWGGLDKARYPWGDELLAADGTWRTNIWQGTFPTLNTRDDGWLTTAPVRTYAPNAFGLWQTVGTVWEWCEDVFNPHAYRRRASGHQPVFNPRESSGTTSKVLRGGSYLCHDSYCNRYRNAARSSNTPESSMGNAGFRTVAS